MMQIKQNEVGTPVTNQRRKMKGSHLLNIVLIILLVATFIFAYLYINSTIMPNIKNVSAMIKPIPPKFVANIYGPEDRLLKAPLAIAATGEGNFVVADSGNSQIQVFNNKGQLIKRFGEFGSDAGQFNYPSSIAVNSEGLIYVGEFNNNRIQVFSQDGKLVTTLSKKKLGYTISPLALTFDEEDNLYIANRTGEIIVLDRNGKNKLRFGAGGAKPGNFSYPNGIAVGPSKNIYVSDSGNFRIQVFDSTGKLLKVVEHDQLKVSIPKGIAVDKEELIYLVDNFQHRVNVYNKEFEQLFTFGVRGLNEGELNFPNGICVEDNEIYITDRENNRIAIFSY